jgi:hypothetical protein
MLGVAFKDMIMEDEVPEPETITFPVGLPQRYYEA